MLLVGGTIVGDDVVSARNLPMKFTEVNESSQEAATNYSANRVEDFACTSEG